MVSQNTDNVRALSMPLRSLATRRRWGCEAHAMEIPEKGCDYIFLGSLADIHSWQLLRLLLSTCLTTVLVTFSNYRLQYTVDCYSHINTAVLPPRVGDQNVWRHNITTAVNHNDIHTHMSGDCLNNVCNLIPTEVSGVKLGMHTSITHVFVNYYCRNMVTSTTTYSGTKEGWVQTSNTLTWQCEFLPTWQAHPLSSSQFRQSIHQRGGQGAV